MINAEEWIKKQLDLDFIQAEDIPNIELYMDQITTFMDTRLAGSKRYPDDKIMTKTMINNYTKNHLLPPSVKKKYSKEHIYLLILIYYMKNILSITDIQTLIEPITQHYFPKNPENNISLDEIYTLIMDHLHEDRETISKDILASYESASSLFADKGLSSEDNDYLLNFSFICKMAYDIYLRKQLIEKLLDVFRDEHPKSDKKSDKKKGK